MRKTKEELQRLNTKNLLRYFKAERKRFHRSGYWCKCGCGEKIWEVKPVTYANMEQKYNEHDEYLQLIKSVLSTREHIIKIC